MINESIKATLEIRNKIIIDAIIKKAEKVCPNSLALIGVYGSFSTGDICEKSDLDLLIIINNDDGWNLGTAFIQGEIGQDIYCTCWKSLEHDAEYHSPHISKLMDSKIVYCADEKYNTRLSVLRNKASMIINAEFNETDYKKSYLVFENAITKYAHLILSTNIRDCRYYLADILYEIENAICLLNKKYFKLGIKRVFEELDQMPKKPANLIILLKNAVFANNIDEIKKYTTELMAVVETYFSSIKSQMPFEKPVPTVDSLRGSYEEMFSNWRNKMYDAAENNDHHLSFMTMASLQRFLCELSSEYEFSNYDVIGKFDPNDLLGCAVAVDRILQEYLKEYRNLNISILKYETIDEFKKDYLAT